MTQYEAMAARLQEAREAAQKTQKDAAEYLGCTYQAISNYERAKTKIDSVSLMRLLLYYKVDIYDFLESCGFEELEAIKGSAPAPTAAHIVNRFTDEELNLVFCYRQADPGTQSAVRKLLDIPEAHSAENSEKAM